MIVQLFPGKKINRKNPRFPEKKYFEQKFMRSLFASQRLSSCPPPLAAKEGKRINKIKCVSAKKEMEKRKR